MKPNASRAQTYWRRNLQLIAVLLAIWFCSTFVVAWFARELSSLDFFDWPFSYWVGAQGALIVYLAVVMVYARSMNRIDRSYQPPQEAARPDAGDESNASTVPGSPPDRSAR